ncbi:MAG: hypothetical protein ABR506_01120, partial [Candidatus Krumholzibacteriia bacterium]
LMTLVQVNLSEPLAGRWRFLYRLDWQDSRHMDVAAQQHWLGFGAALVPGLEAELQVHPAAAKEELDLRAGFLVAGGDRTCYLRLAVRWDDFLYEEKNDRGGLSRARSTGLQGELRWAGGPWELAAEGHYGSSWARTFPDSARSPQVSAAGGRQGGGGARLRFLTGAGSFVQAGLNHWDFRASEARRDGEGGYAYRNAWLHARALAVLDLSPRVGLRPEFHWLRQWATADGRRTFDHRREDLFPALFVQWRTGGRTTWELGYMAVHYSWQHAGVDDAGYTDKVKLGWIFAPTPAARLQLSLSHEVDLDRFGGGNIQYQMLF